MSYPFNACYLSKNGIQIGGSITANQVILIIIALVTIASLIILILILTNNVPSPINIIYESDVPYEHVDPQAHDPYNDPYIIQ